MKKFKKNTMRQIYLLTQNFPQMKSLYSIHQNGQNVYQREQFGKELQYIFSRLKALFSQTFKILGSHRRYKIYDWKI
jgi:hypothetical protein